ncbi:hypothetical protein [Paenochrobactrum glaciei]
MSDKDNNSTEHFKIVKPDPVTPVSDDVHTIRTAFDLIDALLKIITEAVAKKAEGDHTHDFAGVEGLEDELKEFRRKDEEINLGDLGDVLNPEDAQLNYVLAKTALGFAFRSALSVLGEHQHPMANIVGLQDVLNTFLAGAAGSLDGEIPVFQGTSGKAVGRGGVKLADLIASIASKLSTSGGRMSGTLQFIAELSSVTFGTASRSREYELYANVSDDNDYGMRLRRGGSYEHELIYGLGGTGDLQIQNGSLHVVGAGTSGSFYANGDIGGNVWLPWGHSTAFSAINSRIEQRAYDFAYLFGYSRTADYLVSDVFPIWSLVLGKVDHVNPVAGQTVVGGGQLIIANSNGKTFGGGTYMAMVTGGRGEVLYWKRNA